MAHYDEQLTLRAARAEYFEANGFGEDGGYGKSWVHFRVGPLPVAFPNTAARVRAVRYHDLHHVATGYDTDLRGECEIGAWEIGGSCRGFVAAWILNFAAFAFGLVREPRAVFHAYVRGRHSRNFYDRPWSEELLEPTVGDARRALGLDAAVPSPALADRFTFAAWSVAAALYGVLVLALPVAAFWLLVSRLSG